VIGHLISQIINLQIKEQIPASAGMTAKSLINFLKSFVARAKHNLVAVMPERDSNKKTMRVMGIC
jgi:hypothetical protein